MNGNSTTQITMDEAGALLAQDRVFMANVMNAFRMASEICQRLDAEEAKKNEEVKSDAPNLPDAQPDAGDNNRKHSQRKAA